MDPYGRVQKASSASGCAGHATCRSRFSPGCQCCIIDGMPHEDAFDINAPAPTLLVRVDDERVLAVSSRRPDGEHWLPIASSALSSLSGLLKQARLDEAKASVRLFEMHPKDSLAFDAGRTFVGAEGYSHAFVHDVGGKFVLNARIREVASRLPGGQPSIAFDPATMAMAIALAQIQATLRRIERKLDTIASDVSQLRGLVEGEQEGRILAAAETIGQVYDRYQQADHVDRTDWERLASLERDLKVEHRRILRELLTYEKPLAYTDTASAKKSIQAVEPSRVRQIVQLEWYLLRAFGQWSVLAQQVRIQRQEVTSGDANIGLVTLEGYISGASEAFACVRESDAKVKATILGGIGNRLFPKSVTGVSGGVTAVGGASALIAVGALTPVPFAIAGAAALGATLQERQMQKAHKNRASVRELLTPSPATACLPALTPLQLVAVRDELSP